MKQIYKIPKKSEEKEYKQTIKDYLNDKERRKVSKDCCKILFYTWPYNSIHKREMKHYIDFCGKFYPKLNFIHRDIDLTDRYKSREGIIEKYRKDNYYIAGKMLDIFYYADQRQLDVFGYILITPMKMVNRPGIITSGLARRERGIAIYSTDNSSPITLVHEIGHLLGLRHCNLKIENCIMITGKDDNTESKSSAKEDQDYTFCEDCDTKLWICFHDPSEKRKP